MFIRTIALLSAVFYTTSSIALTIEPTLDDSFISYSEGTSTDYNFTVQEADSDGNLITKYYKIDIDETKVGTSENIDYNVVDSSPYVIVALPNGSMYIKYSYPTSAGGTIYASQQKDKLSGYVDADFIGSSVRQSSSAYGGAIYSSVSSSKIGSIIGDFIGNYVTTQTSSSYTEAHGGAIYNKGTITNIIGTFINNYAVSTGNGNNFSQSNAKGGAIYNIGTIGDITGDFLANHSKVYTSQTGAHGGAIYNSSVIGNITGNFIGNYNTSTSGYSYGGAISNAGSSSSSISVIGDITGDFIRNYANSTNDRGGAIYNSWGKIGNITGDFIGNYAGGGAVGGAIVGSRGTFGDITGDFIGNYITNTTDTGHLNGGAIYLSEGKIGNITGDFIGNYAQASGQGGNGGAIYHSTSNNNQTSVIGNITGNFIGNYVVSPIKGNIYGTSASGGAIANSSGGDTSKASIGNITGDFISNYVVINAGSSSAYGGAISNIAYSTSSAIIGDIINSSFIDNHVSSSTSSAFGGAISNKASSSSASAKIGNIINSSFIDNYVIAPSSARGGAIYTNSDMNIVADNGISKFSGNYIQSSSTGTKSYEAIYVDSDSATLGFTAKNNGVIEFDDYINGVNGYNVNITGDASGTVNLYNDIKNADVSTNLVTINTVNNEIHNYVFNTLTSDASVSYTIDIDVANQNADMFTTTSASSGIVTLDKLNMIEGYFTDLPQDMTGKEFKIQILKTQNNDLQLVLSDAVKEQLGDQEYKIFRGYHDTYDEIKTITSWDDIYNIYTEIDDFYGTLGLATTDTTNDSIGINITNYINVGTEKNKWDDTLKLLNQFETSEIREFNATQGGSTYIVMNNLGKTSSGTLTINGFNDTSTKSIVDFANHSGFELTGVTTLNINDVEVKNAFSEYGGAVVNNTNSDSVINITNVDFIDNSVIGSSAKGGAIYTNSDINIVADNGISKFSGNYTQKDSNGTKNYEAIYIGNYSATLNLIAKNNGVIEFDDYINGAYGYNVNITGDTSGTVNLYNDIKNAYVSTNSVTINTANEIIHDYVFNTLISDASASYIIDIDVTNQIADTFTITSDSNGIVTLGELNIISGGFSDLPQDMTGKDFKIQILKTYNDNLQLALSETVKNQLGNTEYKIGGGYSYTYDKIRSINTWEDTYNKYSEFINYYGSLGLATTYTTNDSIGLSINRQESLSKENVGIGDTLQLLNQYETTEAREFNATENTTSYNVIENLGETASGMLSVNGLIGATTKSVLDFDNHSGFELTNETILNLNNIEIKNASYKYSENSNRYGGSVIYVDSSDAVVNINNVDFVNNSVVSMIDDYASIYGGAILNNYAIGNITGNFTDNYIETSYYGYGGTIYNSGTIGNITGDFSDNHINSNDAYGGAIFNIYGSIGNITGNFTNNFVNASGGDYGGASGGAINNNTYGNIDNIINSSFTNNYVIGDYASGGAINNGEGSIGNIVGNFEGNYVIGDYAYGGAISNDTYGNIDNIINSSFTNNYVIGSSAYGGAIYTYSNLNIVADGGVSRFSGNYIQNVSNGTKDYEAIYVSRRYATLSLIAKNNGVIEFDDYINGNSGYDVVLTGDASGTINLYNDIKNADVFTDTITINTANEIIHDYVFNTLTSDASANYIIDVDTSNLIADTFTTTSASNGIITLGELNFIGSAFSDLPQDMMSEGIKIQILKTQNDNLQLALSDSVKDKFGDTEYKIGSGYGSNITYDEIKAVNTWEDSYNKHVDVIDYYGTLGLATMDTTNDSIGLNITKYIISGTEAIKYGDTLQLLNQYETAEAREFNATKNTTSYNVTENLGETASGMLSVNGLVGTTTKSVLDFDNHSGFELTNETILNLNNIEIKNASYEYSENSNRYGGSVIYVDSSDAIININSVDFAKNHVASVESTWVNGGAIYNNGTIGDIVANFVENYISSSDNGGEGGAIFNGGTIGNITGDFIGNYTDGEWTYGGAIENYDTIGDITGNFTGNYAHTGGGAIENYGNSIGNITGDFIGNYVESIADDNEAYGGAISTYGDIGNITGDFISNHTKGYSALGGAISNNIDYGHTIGDITGDFIGNYAEGKYMALGGAMFTMGNSEDYETGTITGSFIDNYVKVTDESGFALGGAIFVDGGELTFKADGITNRFSGNYVEDSSGITNNAIWVNTYQYDLEDFGIRGTLNFEVKNGGAIVFDDEIDGGFYDWDDKVPIKDGYGYNVNIYGDVCPQCIVNSVIFNSKVKNVYNLTLDTTQMVLGKDAHIQIVNDYIATGETNPYLRLDVDAVNSKTGQLEIGGQVIGTTQVIANIVNYKDVRGEESIVFATAENDTTGGEESFKIFRTIGSPYKWYVDYDETAKTWGLAMGEETNDYEEDCYPETEPEPEPNPEPTPQPLGPIEVEPEVIGFEALQSAGLSQTNGMVYNIMRKVGVNRLYCPGCGFYDYNWDGEAFHNVWVDTTYNGLTIEAPVEIEAKVWGIEAGADIQKDLNNKLGIFVSYRQGNYEMDGKGEKYYSKVGSELDIDSYLAGLYYRYDYNNWYAFATLYGGMQNAEIQTDDGVSADTDGLEFGGSAEVGYSHALNKTVYITPSLGVFYSQISYDDASDDYGKTVEYGDLKQVELEAGLKLSKAIYTDNGTASIYVKPSVVQTLVDGDEINITEIGKVDTIEDQTLGRIEIGGSYGFNDNWSAYGWANYTFGSDYEATSLGAGLNYAW